MRVNLPHSLRTTLVLVRHGESTWIAEGRFQGRADPSLSALGEQQAELVAQRLAERDRGAPLPMPPGPPVGIWHSPLSRAAQTARRIAELQPGTKLQPSDGLTEIAQGEWEGLTHAEVDRRWSTELAAWQRAPTEHHAPGGESLGAAAPRVSAAIGEIIETLATAGAPPEPWAVLVAHDGIFRLALFTLLDLPLERFWSFPFNLCAISVLSVRDGVAALRAHNLSEHLAPLAGGHRTPPGAGGDRGGAL